jgi:hypothetical protein
MCWSARRRIFENAPGQPPLPGMVTVRQMKQSRAPSILLLNNHKPAQRALPRGTGQYGFTGLGKRRPLRNNHRMSGSALLKLRFSIVRQPCRQ